MARPYAVTYLKTLSIFMPINLIGLICIGILRGLKDSQTILKLTLTSACINVLLDLLFVFRKLTFYLIDN